MKKDQEELLNNIQNVFNSLSSEYIYDLFKEKYKTILWKNLSTQNKRKYLESTIAVYSNNNENFNTEKLTPILNELLSIIEHDEIIELNEVYIYKELYKILRLIDITYNALDILHEKNYPRDFGKLQSDQKKLNTKRTLYKKLLVGEDRLVSRKEARLRYWVFTLYYKNRNLVDFFLQGFLVGDLVKIKDLHEENENNQLFLSTLNYFLMQKTTTDAVIKNLGILLYGEMTEYLNMRKGESKELIKWIIDGLFHQNINVDEFYGHIFIKSTLGHIPIFGTARQSKYTIEENDFIKKRLLKDMKELNLIDKETFDTTYENNTKNPHIQFLKKYPLEFFRKNPKYSDINI